MTGVITFLCCSDTRWYVTAAGSICPVAPAPVFAMANVICSFGITPAPAGRTARRDEERGTQTTKCDSTIANVSEGSSCLRYFICFVHVIIVHDATMLSFVAVKPRETSIFRKNQYLICADYISDNKK